MEKHTENISKYIKSRFAILILASLITGIFNPLFSAYGSIPQEGVQDDIIIFRVQVSSSFEDPADLQKLKAEYEFSYPVGEYFHKGIYKYLVGSFANYDEAREYRNKLIYEKGIVDAFIVATRNGEIVEKWERVNQGDISLDNKKETDRPEKTVDDKSVDESDTIINIGEGYGFIEVENLFPHLATGADKKPDEAVESVDKKESPEKSTTENKGEGSASTGDGKTITTKQDTQKATSDTSTQEQEKITDETDTSQNVAHAKKEEKSPTASKYRHVSEKKKKVKKKHPFPLNLFYAVLHVVDTTFNSNRIIIVAIVLILFFQFSFALLVVFMVIARFVKSASEKKERIIRENYQNIIADYLFSEESEIIPPELLKIKSRKNAEILLEEVLLLHRNLSGETYDRLMKLYLELSLHQFSIKKLSSRRWHRIAKGLRELTQMNIKSAISRIEDLVNSANEVVRMEAQMSLIRLNKTQPFSFLEKFTGEFNEWEKLNIHNLVETHKIEIPKFKKWLNSHNDSVVIFCLQMIHIYKQADAFEDTVKLLDHPNKEVIKNAIKALGTMGEPKAIEFLKNKYNDSYYQNKLRIIQALGIIGEEGSLIFLENILDEGDFDMRFETAIAMHKIGGTGMLILVDKLKTADHELQKIIKHILDEKI